jgi:hypothetical protein
LSLEDLYAALVRARALSRDSLIEAEVDRLRFLESDAELDADAFEEQAELNEESAAEAREEAERLRHERVAFEADAAKLRKR